MGNDDTRNIKRLIPGIKPSDQMGDDPLVDPFHDEGASKIKDRLLNLSSQTDPSGDVRFREHVVSNAYGLTTCSDYVEVPILYSMSLLDTNTNRKFIAHVPSEEFKKGYGEAIVFLESNIHLSDLESQDAPMRDLHVITEMRDSDGELVAYFTPVCEGNIRLSAPITYDKTPNGRVRSIHIDKRDISGVSTASSLDALLRKPYFKRANLQTTGTMLSKIVNPSIENNDALDESTCRKYTEYIERTIGKVECGHLLNVFLSSKLLVVAYHPSERFMYAEAIDVSGALETVYNRFNGFFKRLMEELPDPDSNVKHREENVISVVRARLHALDSFESVADEMAFKFMYRQSQLKDLRYAVAGFLPNERAITSIPSKYLIPRNNETYLRMLDAFYTDAESVFAELRHEFEIPENRFKYLDAYHLPELRGFQNFLVEANPENGTVVISATTHKLREPYTFCKRVTLAEDVRIPFGSGSSNGLSGQEERIIN